MSIVLSSPLSSASLGADWQFMSANGTIGAAATTTGIAGFIDPSTAPDGSAAVRFTINGADADTNGIRSELIAPVYDVGPYWFASDVWIPSGFGAGQFAFIQMHDVADGGDPSKVPNIDLFVIDGVTIQAIVPKTFIPNTTVYTIIGECAAILDRWVRCVMYCRFAQDASGWIEIFYDGKPLAKSWWAPSRYDDVSGPCLELGLYDYLHAGFTGTRRVWQKNIRIGDSSESYTSILGQLPIPRYLPAVF